MDERPSPSDPRLWADLVVTRLQSVGLELHAVRRAAASADRERLTCAIGDLDRTICDIHTNLLPRVVDNHNTVRTEDGG